VSNLTSSNDSTVRQTLLWVGLIQSSLSVTIGLFWLTNRPSSSSSVDRRVIIA